MSALQLTKKQHEKLAHSAINMLQAIPHDSFGPTDAIRALPDYDSLTPEDREAVRKALDKIIGA
ncbi:minor tail protein [Xanthomonas phage Elanor]|uniref:Minor tail protein n=1 Tax=Xanthomonas phage Elanor TaxID=2939127 RepID=A0A9E7E1Q2_9CAUD|nr:minor tail protein [Xanthomonas phage Elanor]URA06993.1 minor tail protein [Xanthomonas phage Elanor]